MTPSVSDDEEREAGLCFIDQHRADDESDNACSSFGPNGRGIISPLYPNLAVAILDAEVTDLDCTPVGRRA